ncbi:hypothetical protein G6F59_018518 [Rhizopus arrhizus]|nr:hypothetical protein G6F24_016362 [Rhizopus arrhizus]KAG1373254.1 hypothetical protein G6F59_018518 [Rhizopus arrhizus]
MHRPPAGPGCCRRNSRAGAPAVATRGHPDTAPPRARRVGDGTPLPPLHRYHRMWQRQSSGRGPCPPAAATAYQRGSAHRCP